MGNLQRSRHRRGAKLRHRDRWSNEKLSNLCQEAKVVTKAESRLRCGNTPAIPGSLELTTPTGQAFCLAADSPSQRRSGSDRLSPGQADRVARGGGGGGYW